MAARRALTRNLATLATRSSVPRIASLSSRMSSPSSYTSKIASRRLHATAKHLRPATTTAASTADSYPHSHDPIESPVDTQNFLDNKFVPSKATTWLDLYDPATNNLVTRVPQSTKEELKAAVESAQNAFPGWRKTSLDRKSVV